MSEVKTLDTSNNILPERFPLSDNEDEFRNPSNEFVTALSQDRRSIKISEQAVGINSLHDLWRTSPDLAKENPENEGLVIISIGERGECLSGQVTFDLHTNVLGRNSAHGVFFGDIKRADEKNKNGTDEQQVGPTSVAVKPFSRSRTNNACHELLNLDEVKRRGIPTVTPLGIFLTDHYTFLITRKDIITSLDNLNYSPLAAKIRSIVENNLLEYFATTEYQQLLDSPTSLQMQENDRSLVSLFRLIRDLGIFLAEMHSRGIFHGDSQIKNFAIDSEGNLFCLDLEKATIIFEGIHNTNISADKINKNLDRMGGDLYKLFLSFIKPAEAGTIGITGIGIFSHIIKSIQAGRGDLESQIQVNNKVDTLWKLFQVVFLQHYTNTLKNNLPKKFLDSHKESLIDKIQKDLRKKLTQHIENIPSITTVNLGG